MTYALIDLTTAAIVAPVADIPASLRGLPDHVLAAPAEHIDPPPEGWETCGLWPVVPDPVPEHDHAAERPEPGALVVDVAARVVRQGWVFRPLTEAEASAARAAALEALADGRWQWEVAGVVWVRPADGKAYGIATDRESQGKLLAERNAAIAGLRDPGDVWKCRDMATGAIVFPTFTDGEIVDIADAARRHVAGAFRREADLTGLVMAGDTSVRWSPPAE